MMLCDFVIAHYMEYLGIFPSTKFHSQDLGQNLVPSSVTTNADERWVHLSRSILRNRSRDNFLNSLLIYSYIIVYNSKIKLKFYACENLNLSDFKAEQSH